MKRQAIKFTPELLQFFIKSMSMYKMDSHYKELFNALYSYEYLVNYTLSEQGVTILQKMHESTIKINGFTANKLRKVINVDVATNKKMVMVGGGIPNFIKTSTKVLLNVGVSTLTYLSNQRMISVFLASQGLGSVDEYILAATGDQFTIDSLISLVLFVTGMSRAAIPLIKSLHRIIKKDFSDITMFNAAVLIISLFLGYSSWKYYSEASITVYKNQYDIVMKSCLLNTSLFKSPDNVTTMGELSSIISQNLIVLQNGLGLKSKSIKLVSKALQSKMNDTTLQKLMSCVLYNNFGVIGNNADCANSIFNVQAMVQTVTISGVSAPSMQCYTNFLFIQKAIENIRDIFGIIDSSVVVNNISQGAFFMIRTTTGYMESINNVARLLIGKNKRRRNSKSK